MGIDGQRKITSARGETVDFDLLLIKQQLANAQQSVEVQRREEFIDSKEQGKVSRKKPVPPVTIEANQPLPQVQSKIAADDFENSNGDLPAGPKTTIVPEPIIER